MKMRCRETGKGLDVEVQTQGSGDLFEAATLIVSHHFTYRDVECSVHLKYFAEPFDRFWKRLRREIREQKRYVDGRYDAY